MSKFEILTRYLLLKAQFKLCKIVKNIPTRFKKNLAGFVVYKNKIIVLEGFCLVLGFAKAIAVELIFVSFFFKRNKNSGNVKRDPKLRGGHDDAIEGFAQKKIIF